MLELTRSLHSCHERLAKESLPPVLQFCDSKGVPKGLRVPASEILICGFASTMAYEKVAATTLNNWLAGLRAWTLAQGTEWLGGRSEAL